MRAVQLPSVVSLFLSFCLPTKVRGVLDCTEAAFTNILPANTTLKAATAIANNGTYGGVSLDLDFPANATELPPLCVAEFNVTAPDGSFYSFGLFLPDAPLYNARFIATGNTGFGGGINWPAMGSLVQYGFATMSTDSGHESSPNDASWARNAPMHVENWAWRAMHGSVELSKEVVKSYYGSGVKYSYYTACSGGARQGLKDIQLFPEDFDGMVAGAAPWLLSHLHTWAVKIGMYNLPANSSGHLDDDDFTLVNNEIMTQCDALDGNADNILSDPYHCDFNAAALLCNDTTTSNCLSQEQVETVNNIYDDWNDPSGDLIWPSLTIGADASGLAGHPDAPSSFGTEYVENFIANSTAWDWHTLNASTVTLADSIDPGSSNADLFDLSAYQKAGGKLITYHGLADPLIPTGSSIYYHQQVLATMAPPSGTLDDFFRFFLIPGMHHCSGSDGAPYFISGGGQNVDGATHSVPGYEDAQHDVIFAMMAWVENNQAPNTIVATKWLNNTPALGVERQRPLCVFPKQAKYSGHGNFSEAENWACENAEGVVLPSIRIAKEGSVAVASTSAGPGPSPTKKSGAVSCRRNGLQRWSLVLGALMVGLGFIQELL